MTESIDFVSGDRSVPLEEIHRFSTWERDEEELWKWRDHFAEPRFAQKTAVGKCRLGWALYLDKEIKNERIA